MHTNNTPTIVPAAYPELEDENYRALTSPDQRETELPPAIPADEEDWFWSNHQLSLPAWLKARDPRSAIENESPRTYARPGRDD